MSKKISNDDSFESYLGKYIQLNVDGVIRKYYISNINANDFVTQAAILRNYSIIGESSKQECDICEDVCYRNFPVIKVMFQNVVDNTYYNSPYINNYSSEIHEIILNGTSLGRINTTFQKENHNEIWFVPYNPSQIIVSTTYASSSNSSLFNSYTYGDIDSLVLSSFDSSLLRINDYNEISIRPISAWNPVISDLDSFGYFFTPPLSSAFFLNPQITLDIHKIFPLTTNTSSISCQSYTMHNFSWFEGNSESMHLINNDPQSLRFINGGSSGGTYTNSRYINNYLSAGCVFQPYSASFYYFNPCQLVSPGYYPLDPEYYYTYETDENGDPINPFDTRFAYGWEDYGFYNSSPLSNPNLPLLRKYQFFSSANLSNPIFIFVGSNTKNPNDFSINTINNSEYKTRNIALGSTNNYSYDGFANYNSGALYNSKYANELFEGTLYALEDRTWEGGTVRFRQINVYTDSSISTITQNISVGALI